jgi:riboflavin kinase
MDQLGEIGNTLETGIYYGICLLKDLKYPAVVSVGWNPFYHNTKKTIEAHLLNRFDEDFYGETIRVHCLGYLRPEANFESLDDLISCINSDIDVAKERMAKTITPK